MDNQSASNSVSTSGIDRMSGFSPNAMYGNVGQQERVPTDAERMDKLGYEKRDSVSNNWENQSTLGQATLAMPQLGAMPPGAELGVIINENDREREELTGEKAVGTDRPRIQDRDGLSAERLGYIEKGIHERKNDLHALKRFATDEMMAELKGRYGRIFGSEN